MGPLPNNWLAACIADLTPDLQVLLSWGSTVVSFHLQQSFSVSFFHVSLGLPVPRLPSICITCCSDCTTRMPKSAMSSLSKWDWGPQACRWLTWPNRGQILWLDYADPSDHGPIIALQVRLGQWPSFTGMEHGALHARAVYKARGLVREVARCENW